VHMVRVKKTVTTKSIGLSKNRQNGERQSTFHSRNVGTRIKIGKKTKDDAAQNEGTQTDKANSREGRSESPSPRDLSNKGSRSKSRKDGRRTTTIKASLPAAYRSEKDRNGITEMQTVTSDECIDLDELAKIEIDNEKGSGEYLQDEVGIAETSTSTNKSSINCSSNVSAAEATQDESEQFETKNIQEKATKSIQSALTTVDAAFYALGKFVGEKTCHEPSFDTCLSKDKMTPDEEESKGESSPHDSEVDAGVDNNEDVNNSEIVAQSTDSKRLTEF